MLHVPGRLASTRLPACVHARPAASFSFRLSPSPASHTRACTSTHALQLASVGRRPASDAFPPSRLSPFRLAFRHPLRSSSSRSLHARTHRPDIHHPSSFSPAAWQSQDAAANGGGISIPSGDAPMALANGAPLDHTAWSSTGDAPSPSRNQGGSGGGDRERDGQPRRSSRSRSPGARGEDRGYSFLSNRCEW